MNDFYRLTLTCLLATCIICILGNEVHADGDANAGETVEDYICNQKFTGCRIDYKSRKCVMEETVGCTNPFPYHNMVDCLNDFHGKGNKCKNNTCKNGGRCSPITKSNGRRTFKCECSGTRHYGKRCGKACPKNVWKHLRLNQRKKQRRNLGSCINI